MQANIILWLAGLAFVGFGGWALVAPVSFAALIHFELAGSASVTELRAFYGGLELALGAFFIYSAIRPDLTRAGLLLGVFTLAGVATARTFGLVFDGSANPLMLGLLSSEVVGAAACFWALRFRQ